MDRQLDRLTHDKGGSCFLKLCEWPEIEALPCAAAGTGSRQHVLDAYIVCGIFGHVVSHDKDEMKLSV